MFLSFPDAKPAKSLLSIEYPPGFEDGGRRILAECPEFKLWELHHEGGPQQIETAPHLEAAQWRHFFRINDDGHISTTKQRDRMALALALCRLRDYTNTGDFQGAAFGDPSPLPIDLCITGQGGAAVAARLAHTIGRKLADIAEATPNDAQILADDLKASFDNALRAFLVSNGKTPDRRRKGWKPLTPHLIQSALLIFREKRRSPSKSEIRDELEKSELKFTGKDVAGKWRDAFNKAGLSDLPDLPTS
jgi:hypothetical protein